MAALHCSDEAIAYAESRQNTEPLFVFVASGGARPLLHAVQALVASMAAPAPGRSAVTHVWLCAAVMLLVLP
jgi:predicted ATP-dependent serine protease